LAAFLNQQAWEKLNILFPEFDKNLTILWATIARQNECPFRDEFRADRSEFSAFTSLESAVSSKASSLFDTR
jgi:hypothetical protein